MTTHAKATVFSKNNCSYCSKAKKLLQEANIPFTELEVSQDKNLQYLARQLSSSPTVPQIFIGDKLVGNFNQLQQVVQSTHLSDLLESEVRPLDIASLLTIINLESDSLDYPLKNILPSVDASHSANPRDLPILRMYKKFFGFWPHCFGFMYHWPEVAYRQFVYCHNAEAIALGKNVLTKPVMLAVGYATSNAHGCNYCQIHTASVGGGGAVHTSKNLEQARKGEESPDNPYGPFEVALAELAANATTNSVEQSHHRAVFENRTKAKGTKFSAQTNIMATSMVVSAFGFLNVFNDLTGVSVEQLWADDAQKGASLTTGRHGSEKVVGNQTLRHPIKSGYPFLTTEIARYFFQVFKEGGSFKYTRKKLGLTPNWIKSWPKLLRPLHVRFYLGVMSSRDSESPAMEKLSEEFRHLMIRVSAIEKNNDYQVGIESLLAYNTKKYSSQARFLERLNSSYRASFKEQEKDFPCFSPAERLALRMARVSAKIPLITTKKDFAGILDLFKPQEIVHLIAICSMASMVQRYTAIVKQPMEPEVLKFFKENDLSQDTVQIRLN